MAVSKQKRDKAVALSANPFQLRNASRFALKLRFFDWLGLRWAAAQTRLGISFPNPISASRRYTVFAYSSRIFLREPVSIAERFAFCSETTFF